MAPEVIRLAAGAQHDRLVEGFDFHMVACQVFSPSYKLKNRVDIVRTDWDGAERAKAALVQDDQPEVPWKVRKPGGQKASIDYAGPTIRCSVPRGRSRREPGLMSRMDRRGVI
jgi:hypothetical protein